MTEYAVFSPSAAPDEAPLLALGRDTDAPAPLEDHPDGFAVSRAANEAVCACSSNSLSGEFSPACCSESVLRFAIEFEIAGQTLELGPGSEQTGVAFAGQTYALRVFAAEELAPDATCSAEELASPEFRVKHVAWLLG